MSEYLESIKNAINPSTNVQYGAIEYYPHQPMYLVADITELIEDTGWKPQVAFIEGIKKML